MSKTKSKPRPNPLLLDRTRTGLYQKALTREIKRRMRLLQREITELVATEDSFGLTIPQATYNVFCPTGKGGGIDPTCSPGGGKLNEDWGDGEIHRAGTIQTAKGEIDVVYDSGAVSQDQASNMFEWLSNVPKREMKKSVAKRIELFTIPEDVRRRLESVGIDPEISDEGAVRGAFDFSTGTLYASSWDGYEDSPRNLMHELGHSIMGFEEDAAIAWADTFGNSITTNKAASTQLNILDPAVVTRVMEIQSAISDDDVIKPEDNPHITIRYGLDDLESERVEMLVQQHSSVWVELGGLSLFENDEQDVLKIEVKSKALESLNSHLGILPNTQTHSRYHPHLTIAYLKPGTGKKYVGRSGLEGTKLLFKSMVYSDPERNHTELTFNVVVNVFCPTGPGGGVDPTCKKGRASRAVYEWAAKRFKDPEHAKAFTEWFGDSKVVDENGEPLVVYKAMYPYDWTKETDDGPGPALDVIDRKTEFPSFHKGEAGVKIAGFFGTKEVADRFASNPNSGMTAVYPAYLSFQSPHVIDAAGAKAGDIQFGESGKGFREAIRSGKFDGVIIKNTSDESHLYVALKPTQIKSAIGNRGTFDPTDPVITNQLTTNAIWQFLTTDQKLQEFMTWLINRVSITVLGKRAGQSTSDWLQEHIERVFKKGMERAFEMVKKPALQAMSDFYEGTKAQFLQDSFFRPVSQERVKLLASRALNELEGVTDQMATQMQRTLVDGFIRGDSPYSIARQLNKDVADIGIKRAERIARTEVVRAHNEAQLEGMEALGMEEVGVAVEWSTSGLGITKRGNLSPCNLCAPLKGAVFTLEEAHGMLPRHPNCVVGESKIVAANPLSVLRAHYSGKVVEIGTAKGGRLSVTENHILLTQRGWVRAVEITNADHLFHAPFGDGEVFQDPDDYLRVTSIEDGFASLRESFGVRFETSSNARPEYLHGDGKSVHGKIDIQSLDGLLRDEFQTERNRQLVENMFMFGGINIPETTRLSGKRTLSKLLVATAAAADCCVGVGSPSRTVLRGSFSKSELGRLGVISRLNSVADQNSSDVQVMEAKLLSQKRSTFSGLVELDNLLLSLRRYVDSGSGGEFIDLFDRDSSLFEFGGEAVRVALKVLGDLSDGLVGGLVHFDGLVKECVEFANTRHVIDLPVYDVETQESIYSLNSFLSSNCMCSWIPANVGESDKAQLRTREKIQRAVSKSISAERGKSKRTIDEQRKRSKWMGAVKPIGKRRPKSIV